MRIADARARAASLARLNVFITMTDEDGPGEVVAVKDLIDVRGTPTTGGGSILSPEAATHDAPLITAIRECGCVVIGKTNLHEWAFGSTNINSHYGTVHNPRDETRVAGGSSGGSAAAVAAGLCDWAIGTDTGGSVRVPAALCGVVGFKPTLGAIDTTGVIGLSFSLDTVGSLARDVATATRAVEKMSGVSASAPILSIDPGHLRLAVPEGWVNGLDEQVQESWDRVAAHLPRIPFPPLAWMSKRCLNILFAEAGAYHRAWIEAHPERYGPEVLERLRDTFLAISGADYVEASSERGRVRAEVARAMDGYDAILVPASACVAPVIQDGVNTEPMTRFTRPFSYTGQPVFSIPAPAPDLPVGIQIVGLHGRDAELAGVALALERAWKELVPQPFRA